MIIVVDFGGQTCHLIARRVRELGVSVKIVSNAFVMRSLHKNENVEGIILSGGSAMLRNLDELIAQATGVATYVAEEPLLCVAKGTGIALENLEAYKRSIMATK